MNYEIIKYRTTLSKEDFLQIEDEACFLHNGHEFDSVSTIFKTNEKKAAFDTFGKCKAAVEVRTELYPCVYIEIIQYELWHEDILSSVYVSDEALKNAKAVIRARTDVHI